MLCSRTAGTVFLKPRRKKKKSLSSRGQMWKISSQKIIGWKVLSMKLLWKRVSNISFSGDDQVPAVILTEV